MCFIEYFNGDWDVVVEFIIKFVGFYVIIEKVVFEVCFWYIICFDILIENILFSMLESFI